MADGGKRCLLGLGIVVAILGILMATSPTGRIEDCPLFKQGKLDGSEGDDERPVPGAWMASIVSSYPVRAARQLYDTYFSDIDPETGLRWFTLEELRRHDGEDPTLPLCLAIGGDVFDVGGIGYEFYGPGMGYHVFAGRDSTRALTLGSLMDDDIQRGGDTSDFTPEQMKSMKEQHEFYLGKYPRIGRLRPY